MIDNYLNTINSFPLKDKTKELFKKQVELFYKDNKSNNKKYNKGDEIILSKNNLIHGARSNIEGLETIASRGLISSEFYAKLNPNKKKPYVVEFWEIREEIKLSDWIKKYAGVTIDFYNREGKVYKSVISSFEDVKSNIQKEREFRDYLIYQNQEQRYVPNDIVDNESTVAFIIEYSNNDEIIKNDIFNKSFDKEITKDILPEWFYEKYMKDRSFDNYETGREKAFIFGLPVYMIKGIMVSRVLEKDISTLNKIRELFPNCYICNIDGVVI